MTSNSSSPPNVPPFYGFVETTVHALRLIHAARQGVIPRITRRLNDSERRTMVHSGAVFVFSVEESGIKRWTDGLLWSPSRIVGNFLVYREINERSSSRGSHKKSYPTDETSSRGVVSTNSQDHRSFGFKGLSQSGLPTNDQGTFKPNGLIKKTITVTIDGSDLHLISYYTSEDVRSGRLKRPHSRPDIMALNMPPHIFRLTNFRNPPKVDIGSDGKPRLVCEAEDTDSTVVKIEESTTYQIPHGSTWSSDRAGHGGRPYGGAPVSPVSHSTVSSSFYATDRWSEPYESSHSPPRSSEPRGQMPWSVSPTQLHHHNHLGSGRRSDDTSHPDSSWPSSSPPSHSANWPAEPYGLSAVTSDIFVDPTRSPRSGNNQYHNSSVIAHSRAADESSYSPGHGGHGVVSNQDVGSHQRLSWMLPTESSECDRGSRNSTRNPFSPGSTTSLSHHYAAINSYSPMSHSFSAAWPSSGASPLESPSSPVFSSRTQLGYDTGYSGHRADDDYVTVEDYGEF